MSARNASQTNLASLSPAADIVQRDDSFYILLDMPGVNKETLDVSVDGEVLTVSGTTSYPELLGAQVWRNEFDNVEFVRRFTLSDAVDKDNIKASLRNGVVTLHLPKSEKLQPKKIQIENG